MEIIISVPPITCDFFRREHYQDNCYMYSTNNSGWRQELTPYYQYEEERVLLDLDIVFVEFMAYHASCKANDNAIQKQETQCAKVFFEDYQGEPKSQFYYQNEA